MPYIDGFVVPVRIDNKENYHREVRKAAELFKSLGATRVVEAWGDEVPDGKVTDFRRSVQAQPEETVVFSWMEWPDKATRDEGMKKAFEHMSKEGGELPFDGKRMIYGGFVPLVDL